MKKKKKLREIRSAVTMMLVMVAMLSTATYAWFTMTSNPVVAGLEMTAKSSGGLLVSLDHENWKNAVDVGPESEDTKLEVKPATLLLAETQDATQADTQTISRGADENGNFTAPKLYEPLYSESAYKVSDKKLIELESDLKDYAVWNTYYVKNETGAEVKVGIKTVANSTVKDEVENIGVTENGTPNLNGSFVIEKSAGDTSTADNSAIDAVRIALLVYEVDENGNGTGTPKVIVWEPNADSTTLGTPTFAENGLKANGTATNYEADFRTKTDGTFLKGGSSTDLTSNAWFSIPNDQFVKVDMFMWFEGQDDQCVNEIMKDTIISQIEFCPLTTNEGQ